MKRSQAVDLIWHIAVQEAVAARSHFIEPEHFFEALTKGKDFARDNVVKDLMARGVDVRTLSHELRMVPGLLEKAGANPTELRRSMRAFLGNGTHDHKPGELMHRSDRARTLFSVAGKIAGDAKLPMIQAGVLWGALLAENKSPTREILGQKGVNPDTLMNDLMKHLWVNAAEVQPPADLPVKDRDSDAPVSGSILERFGRDLTEAAKNGVLSPVIGRRKEILQLIRTLARKTKSNPVLVGEAGVGKTAVVEALAQRIVDGKDASVLGGKRIVEISMGGLVAGTKYRGEFEDRLKRLMEEVKGDSRLILFIDEIHTMIGAGDRRGGLDAANLLKPALARGEIKCIGATTIDEYRRHIETDPALERRFDKIIVPEPARADAVKILAGLKPRFEKHYQLCITRKAIEAAVDLSIRFDGDHRLPDKAIDLLDLACAQIFMPDLSLSGHVGEKRKAGSKRLPIAAVVSVLSEKTGIPEDVISAEIGKKSQIKPAELKGRLLQRIIGQDEAVDRVCNRLMLAHAALGDRRGPMGVFLFMGPSGVGKTELARALAEGLFGAEKNLIRLDMSEYMEQHSVARLIGSPPGYIGHDEDGQLTGKLRTTPYAIVLLDEVEKAHPRVLDIFLQVFDDGRITDGKGRTVDAHNAIFIMTSNIGPDAGGRSSPLGFNQQSEAVCEADNSVLDELKKHFRIELINRIDEIVSFSPLPDAAITAIARNMLEKLVRQAFRKYKVKIEYDEQVLSLLCKKANSPEFGARNLHRVIQESIEIPLAKHLSSGQAREGLRVFCGRDSGDIEVKTELPDALDW